MALSLRTTWHQLLVLGLLALGGLSCGRELTGPERLRFARGFSFVTEFGPDGPSAAALGELVPVQAVRVVLKRANGNTALDRVVTFPENSDEVAVSLDVPLSLESGAAGEEMDLALAYIGAAGDTVFRATERVLLLPTAPGAPPPQPVEVRPVFTGTGANAASVRIAPRADTVIAGAPFVFTAQALDAQQLVIANTPIEWRSLDPALASVASITAGSGTSLAGRGVARIVARLLNGPADTVLLTVLPRPSILELASGSAQSAVPGATLQNPIVVRVRGSDNLPVAGVEVSFAVTGGGGSVSSATAVTNASGLAQVEWTLGAALGGQSITASVPTLTGSPLTISATAMEPPLTLLHYFPLNVTWDAVVGGASGDFRAAGSFVDGALRTAGTGSSPIFSDRLVPTSGSYSLSVFVRSAGNAEIEATYLAQGIAGGPRFRIGQNALGQIVVNETWNTGVAALPADGKFHQVALASDATSNQTRLFVDGTLVATLPQFLAIGAGGSATTIGGDVLAPDSNLFFGDFDELRVYSGALTSAEVATIWNAGPSALGRLVISQTPQAAIAGLEIVPPVLVRAEDATGRVRNGFNGPITIALSVNPTGATLGGTLTINAIGGTASFADLSINLAGAGYRLVATAADAVAAISDPFSVQAASAAQLVFTSAPSTIETNATVPALVVEARDAQGNLATGFSGAVTLSINSGPAGAILAGTATVNAVAGVATFSDVAIDLAGNYTFTATATGLASAVTGTVTASVGAGSRLVFTTQPLGTIAGAVLSPMVVTVFDNGSNVATTYTGPVTLSLLNNPGGAVLGGSVTVNAVAGIATFSTVTVSLAGVGYRLAASAAGLTTGNSAAFDITPAAVTNAWINATGGLWSTAANWSQGRAPSVTDSVLIALNGTYTVTMDQAFTGAVLTVGGGTGVQTLSAVNRTLSFGGNVFVRSSGVLVLQGGALNGAAPVSVEGQLRITGSASIGAPLSIEPTGVIEARSSNVGGSVTATVVNGFTNRGSVDLVAADAGYSTVFAVTNGTLVNAAGGQIRSLAGTGTRTLAAQLDNQGSLAVQYPLTVAKAGAQHVNSGTIALATQNLTITQSGTSPSFTNIGAISIASGRTLAITGGAVTLTGGTLTGTGTLSLTTVALVATTAEMQSRIDFNTGTSLASAFTVPAGDSILVLGGTFTAPALTVDGRFVALGAISIAAPLSVSVTGVVEARSSNVGGTASLTVVNGFTNNGTIDLVAVDAGYTTTFAVTNGSLVNAVGAQIRSRAGTGTRTLAAQLDNRGTLAIEYPLTLARASSQHLNSGSIALGTQNLTITQTGTNPSFTNTGTISLGSGRTLSITGGAVDLTAGTLTGESATLSLTNVAFAMTPVAVRTRFDFNTGTTLAGPYTIPAGDSLRVLAGTLNSAGLVVQGSLIGLGSVTIAAPVTLPSGGRIEARSSNVGGTATVTVVDGFTNNGTIELVAVDAGYTTTFAVTNGSLVNEVGAQIRSVAGTGTRTLAAQLDNRGTLAVEYPLTLTRASSQHLNSGTIALSTQNLTITQTGISPSFTNTGSITLASGRTLSVTGGALDLTAGTLTGDAATLSLTNVALAMTPATVRTRFDFNTGTTLAGPYTIPAGDSLRVLAGTLNSAGLVVQGSFIGLGSVTVAAPVSLPSGGRIVARSSNVGGTASLTVVDGFTNNGTIDLIAVDAGYTTTFAVANGTLVNAAGAQIRSLAGTGARTLAAQLDNQGSLLVEYPLTLSRASAQHLNSGSIALSTQNLTITQTGTSPSFTNTGTITLASGRTLSVTGGALDLTAGSLTGESATLSLTNVALAMTPAAVRTRLDFNTGTSVAGPYTIPAGDSLRVLAGTLSSSGLVVQGTFVALGSVTVAAPVTLPSGGRIEARSSNVGGTAALTVVDGFTNNGTIDLVAVDAGYTTTFAVTNGTLVNGAGAQLRSLSGTGARVLAAQLDNQGTLTIDHPLTLSRVGGQHVNSGTIALATQNLTITQTGTSPSFTNTGAISLASGRTLTVTGGALDLTSGTLTGEGATLSLTNVALSMAPASARTRFDFNTGTTLAGPYTIPSGDSLRVLGGTITSAGLVVQGTLVGLGAVTVAAPVTLPVGGRIEARSSNVGGTATVTVVDGFTNNGTIDLVAVDAGYTTTFAVTNGTLVNAPGAQVRSLAGTGSRTLAAQLDNQGTLVLDFPLAIARASSQHKNSGTIALTTQNLTVNQTGTSPSFVNTGAITIGSGRTLTFNGGALDLTGGTLVGPSGTLSLSNVALTATNAELRSRVNFNSGSALTAPYLIPANDTLVLVGGALNGPGLTIDGRLIALGTSSVAAAVTSNVGSAIEVRSSNVGGAVTLTVTNGFENRGDIDIVAQDAGYGTAFTVTNGTLVNAAGARIRSLAGTGSRTLIAQLDNRGLLSLDLALSIARASSQHLNSGTIDLTNANLSISSTGTTPSFTNTGNIILPAARTFTVSGGAVDLSGGSITGTGRVSLTNVALALGAASADPIFDFNTGSSLSAPYVIPVGDTLRLDGGTVGGAALTVNGRLIVSSTSVVGGPFAVSSGAFVDVVSSAASGSVTLTSASGFTNNGTILLTSTNATYGSALAVTSGTLVNAASGVIRNGLNVGSAGSIQAELNNLGVLDVLATVNLNKASAQHQNQGTINIPSPAVLTVNQTGTAPSFTNTGSINVTGTGRNAISISGGTVNLMAGLIEDLSDLSVLLLQGPTVTMNPANVRLFVNFGSSGTTLAAPLVIAANDTLLVDGGTIAGPGLEVQGTLIGRAGVATGVTVTAPLTTSSTARIELRDFTLTTPQSWTNNGELRLTSAAVGSLAQVSMAGATLTNSSTGSIVGTLGAGQSRNFTLATLDNQGSINVNAPMQINGSLLQKGLFTVPLTRTQTVSALSLEPGSTTSVLGILNVTTCNKNGGAISGTGTIPALCLP